MQNFDFTLPSQGILFGAGKLAEIGAKAAAFGGSALLVATPFTVKNGLAGRVCEYLKSAGVRTQIYDGIIPNPTTQVIDEGAKAALACGAKLIIGLGGGSAMDTAKGIAVAATHGGEVWPYAIGEKEITDKTLPMIAVTTTSGSGSQCTCFSVITNPETNQKPGMGSPYILPKIAIVDPELILSVPKTLTMNTGFDVFAHAVEAYTSKAANPLSDVFAEKAITLFAENFGECIENGSNLEARSALALADTCSGIAINHAVVSLAHVMAHIIGGHFHDIAHGDALYSIYRGVLAHNAQGEPEKHAWIAGKLQHGSTDIVKAFDSFFAPFKYENSLRQKSPDTDKIRELAEDTFTYMKEVTELNPHPADIKDAEDILQAALA